LRRFDAYRLTDGDNIGDPRVLNARFDDVDGRLAQVEAISIDADAAIAAITATGLQRLNDALAPAFAEAAALADVGVWFSAHSTTDNVVENGIKIFQLDEVDRQRFAPAAYLAMFGATDVTKAMMGALVSYDRTTGTLTVNVDRSAGGPSYNDWNISAASATDYATAAEEAAASAAAAAASLALVVSDKTDVVNYLDTALSARNDAEAARDEATAAVASIAADAASAASDAAGAATSETNAGISEAAALASSTASTASAASAASHAADALASDTSAAGHASAAAASDTSAAAHATAAGASDTSAAGHATAALASQTAAAGSATAAAGYEAAVVAAGASYGQIWLGAHATDPVLDNVGGALVQGAAYLNTTTGYLKYYLTGAWTNVVVPTGSSVLSAFGRTGAVVAVAGDYTTAQISRSAVGGIAGITTELALVDLKAQIDTKQAAAALTAYGLTLVGLADASALRTNLGLVIGTDVQAYDAELAALAGLVSAADRLPYFTGSGAASLAVFTAAGRTLVAGADASAQRTTLGVRPGTDVQVYNATLTSIAALGSGADKFAYTTAPNTWAEGSMTAAGRAIAAGASAAAQRTTLGLVPGTDVQVFDATLTSLAALGTGADKLAYTTGVDVWAEASVTSAGRSVLAAANAAAIVTFLGLGIGSAVQAYGAGLTPLGGLVSAADRVPYYTGSGTADIAAFTAAGRALVGGASAAAQRTTLSLVPGTDVQAYDATLLSIALLGTGADKLAYTTGVDTWAETGLSSVGRTLIAGGSASAMQGTLLLTPGTYTQAYDATLTAIAALGTAADKLAYTTGIDTWAEAAFTATGRSIVAGANVAAVQGTLSLTPGTNVQVYDATLTAIAALGTATDKMIYTTGVDTWAELAVGATARTFLSGASTTAMRSTLGVAIGADVQAYDATLLSIALLGTGADKVAYATGVDTWAEATFNALGRSLVGAASVAAAQTALTLVPGTNVQVYDATLLSIALLGTAANKLAYTTGVDTWAETGLSALARRRLAKVVTSVASSATPGPNCDTDELYELTALAAGATFAAPTGSPVDGEILRIRIKDNATAQTLAFNSGAGGYRAGTDLALPTTTVLSKTMYLAFQYNGADSKWDYVAQVGNI
jgi:hypothetical protein